MILKFPIFKILILIIVLNCIRCSGSKNLIEIILYQKYADIEPKYGIDDYCFLEFYFLLINKSGSFLINDDVQNIFNNINFFENSKDFMSLKKNIFSTKGMLGEDQILGENDSCFVVKFFRSPCNGFDYNKYFTFVDSQVISYIDKFNKNNSQINLKYFTNIHIHKNNKWYSNDTGPDSRQRTFFNVDSINTQESFYNIFLEEYRKL